MFTVMVKWADSPRAQRLGKGHTTTRRVHAAMFRTRKDAETAAEQALYGITGIERWWVAPF